MGGIGKTTIARVVFHMVSSKFDGGCFLANIGKVSKNDGLVRLPERIILEIFKESLSIQDVCHGITMISSRLRHKRILLVLDDVNQLNQLNKLGKKRCWFGSGSRVIITTRDKHLLEILGVDEIYAAEGLKNDEALHLLSLKAFKRVHPPSDYIKLSKDVVNYAKGLPLAIEILGSFLFGRSIDKWKSTSNKLKKFPNGEILKVLNISFDGLDEVKKEIFLHIACFFNHEIKNSVETILAYLHLYLDVGIEVLVEKSLIKVYGNELWMHDLVQEMGRDIVYQECPKEPGKRYRLWLFRDIDNVLTNNTGTEVVQGIVLRLNEPKKVYWNPKAFSKMQDLKLLEICGVQLMHDLKHLPNSLRILDWKGYPSKSLTSSFQSKSFKNLKFLKMRESLELTEVPDISEVPNLETLDLQGCINLSRIDPSIGMHKKLTILNLEGCKNLTSLSSKFEMECLTRLNLHGCSKITEIPPSIGIHKKLTILNLGECKNLTSLPSKFEMECLTHLYLCECSKITKIPEFGRNMKHVSGLYLSGTAITTLPTSIEHLTDLVELDLNDCKSLVRLLDTIFKLKLVRYVRLEGCSKLDRLPENLGNAKSLAVLQLSKTAIRKLPSSIGLLKNLFYLSINGCAIRKLPSSIGLLKNLTLLYFSGCKGLSSNKLRYELLPFNSKPTSPHPMDLIFSYLSLSHASSLKGLDLRDCNLKAISNDIGSLFSLEELHLSGNDFVCLPESIIRLSKLTLMNLNNCTSLRSLPKLPLNIERVWADGYISLEMLPDPLKPSDSVEPSLSLRNCFQLADNQSCIDWFLSGIKKYLKLYPYLPLEFLEKSNSVFERSNSIVIPRSEIPEWFSHQSMGNEVEIKQPSHLYNEWMGTAAICIVFCAHVDFPSSCIDFSLIDNGKSVFIRRIHFSDQVSSDHLLLVHLTPQFFNEESDKLMWEGDVNGFNQFRIKMEIDNVGHDSWLKVKKWGFRIGYNFLQK